jgi:hypothetical protein
LIGDCRLLDRGSIAAFIQQSPITNQQRIKKSKISDQQ